MESAGGDLLGKAEVKELGLTLGSDLAVAGLQIEMAGVLIPLPC